jgi:hypothetical protein
VPRLRLSATPILTKSASRKTAFGAGILGGFLLGGFQCHYFSDTGVVSQATNVVHGDLPVSLRGDD